MATAQRDHRTDFPRMLYRFPAITMSASKLQDAVYDTLVVNDQKEADAAIGDGWYLTSPEARKHGETAAQAAAAKAAKVAEVKTHNESPPTRKEMEQEATRLGIKFDGRTSDTSLLGLITEKMQKG